MVALFLSLWYFHWYASHCSQLHDGLTGGSGLFCVAVGLVILASVRVVVLALAVWCWCVGFCHEHLQWCPDYLLARACDAVLPGRECTRAVKSWVGWAVAAGSKGGRAGGDCVDCRCRCRRGCSGVVREAEGAPVVDVDLICSEDQVDAGA